MIILNLSQSCVVFLAGVIVSIVCYLPRVMIISPSIMCAVFLAEVIILKLSKVCYLLRGWSSEKPQTPSCVLSIFLGVPSIMCVVFLLGWLSWTFSKVCYLPRGWSSEKPQNPFNHVCYLPRGMIISLYNPLYHVCCLPSWGDYLKPFKRVLSLKGLIISKLLQSCVLSS